MEYLIGIDSGGTKSELVAYDLDYRPIYKTTGSYGNPSVNLEETIVNLTNIINQCLSDLPSKKCIFILLGISGVETGNYADIIEEHINNTFSIDNIVLNDATLAGKAYLGSNDGILAIAGTGTSCFVQKDNKGELVGGWGHLLGDEGSGYHTVIQAFRRLIFQIDNNLKLDELSLKLMMEIQATDPAGIKKFIYSKSKKEIAALFIIVSKLADEGNIHAMKLLKDAGEHLALGTITAYNKFEFNNNIKIGVKGGVFHNSEIVKLSYINRISQYISNFKLIWEDISSTKAICNIYERRK